VTNLHGELPGSSPDPLEPLDKFRFYREEIKHEFDLITGRLNAYLSAQSFLVLAYAAAMNITNQKSLEHFPFNFATLLTVIGVALSLQALAGIRAADKTIDHWNIKIEKLVELHQWLGDEYQSGVLQKTSRIVSGRRIDPFHAGGLALPRYSPWIFGLTWIVLWLEALIRQGIWAARKFGVCAGKA
jgi:hypothetical protein